MINDIDEIITEFNNFLHKTNPSTISASWIYRNQPRVYRFVLKNHRLETGEIDWDVFTRQLDRKYQKCWVRYNGKVARPYRNDVEVRRVLEKHKDRLYVFLTQLTKSDKETQDWIVIRLVRLSQKGNLNAQEELLYWVKFITDDWLDRYPQMYRWKGYEDEIPERVKACIRCYKYTGSFLGYLFRTLEYSAYGKPPNYSLDDKILDGSKTRIDYAKLDYL